MTNVIAIEGSLNKYRKLASFDCKRMKIFLDGEELLAHKERFYAELLQDGFVNDQSISEGLNGLYRLNNNKYKYLSYYYDKIIKKDVINYPLIVPILMEICVSNASVGMKLGLSRLVNISILKSMGTNMEEAITNLSTGKWVSCISLTEFGHGSNLMKLQTTATYNVKTKTFILHTPTTEAWKCWSGNLGISATHALVLAQLYTSDGRCHGIHWFFTPIRDPMTMKSYPGIIVGNMGEKIGLKATENGFMAFYNYHIPKSCLLNRISDINVDGRFVTSTKNQTKNFALTINNLHSSRASVIAYSCYVTYYQSITIAIRYAFAVSKEKDAILYSPIHQRRLFPHLASAYVFQFVLKYYFELSFKYQSIMVNGGIRRDDLDVDIKDVHILTVALKVIVSSESLKCIQETIEFCGSHGYLEAADLGNLRNNQDANVTLEGDNNILLQQISKTLLSLKRNDKAKLKSNIGLFDFIENMEETINEKCNGDRIEMSSKGLNHAFNWLLCYLFNDIHTKISSAIINGLSIYDAFNIRVSESNTLASVFTETFIVSVYFKMLGRNKPPKDCGPVLMNLGFLYGFCCLEKHMITFCNEKYFRSWGALDNIRNDILGLCEILKNDVVSLVDVLAPPDHILRSVLGKSDGEVYKRLKSIYLSNTAPPSWWRNMEGKSISKL